MAHRREVALSQEQVAELKATRDHHEKPYLRERAAAILKVADGKPVREVAKNGLYKPRRRETVSEWITRYQQHGLSGLLIQSGRGRKPAFSPYGRSA
jgi:transposase